MTEGGEIERLDDPGAELLVFVDEFGLLVRGPADAARAAIDRLLDGADSGPGARRSLSAGDVAAIGSTGLALASTSGEYLRLTAESAAKVKRFGEQVDSSGALRGWVKDGNQFAGQLTFQPVSLAAEQALALQTMGVSLALRSAIADVAKAVERVEGKVDEINKRLDSRLRGDVIGTYRHLEQTAEATNARGSLLQADWDGVAGIRNQLLRDLETLRTHVIQAADTLADRARLPKREDTLHDFRTRRGDVGDMLQLILVTEQSLQLWEYLRLQQVASHEREHLTSAITDAKDSLRRQLEADAELVTTVRAAIDGARVIDPLEYRHLLSKKGLTQEASAFDDVLQQFAVNSRVPALAALEELSQPSLADARDEVGRRAAVAGRAVKQLGVAAGSKSGGILSRGTARVTGAVRGKPTTTETPEHLPDEGDA